jgi:hypothetical protein
MATWSLLQRALEAANLRWAWQQVAANKGAAGADEVSIQRFARGHLAAAVELVFASFRCGPDARKPARE